MQPFSLIIPRFSHPRNGFSPLPTKKFMKNAVFAPSAPLSRRPFCGIIMVYSRFDPAAILPKGLTPVHKKGFLYKFAALLLSFTLLFSTIPAGVSATSGALAGASSGQSSESSGESSSESSGESSGETSEEPSEPSDSASADTTDIGFTVNSTAVYLVNMDSGIVIYQKNADTPMYPASLAKIMTCLLVLENVDDLTETVTTSYTVFDNLWGKNASNAGLYPGEEVRVIDLLYGLMLPSGCDAAGVLAEVVAGSEEAFVQMMNDKAAEIGCTSTHFMNSSGLHDPDQYTTARDMYMITAYAMQYDQFTEIATTYSYTMPATNKNDERTIYHTCSIMNPSSSYYDETIHAIKTGTTDESGRNLVSYASRNAYNYLLITMGAPIYYDDGTTIEQNLSYVDAENLYDWAFDDWAVQTVVSTTDVQGQVKVALCASKDVVNVVPAEEVRRLMLKSIDNSSLQMIPTLVELVDAPVTAGQKLGTLEIRMADETIATVDLVAAESLSRSAWLAFCPGIRNFFTAPAFWIVLLTLVIGFTGWLFAMREMNRRKRRRLRAARKNAPRSYNARSSTGLKKSSTYRGPSRQPQKKTSSRPPQRNAPRNRPSTQRKQPPKRK